MPGTVNITWMSVAASCADVIFLSPEPGMGLLDQGQRPVLSVCLLDESYELTLTQSEPPYNPVGRSLVMVPILQMRMLRLKSFSSYHIQGGRRCQRVSAHGNSWPGATCNSGGILLCTRQASWQGAVHPQLTSSRQVRMRTLLLEARTNGPGGLTTSEGDLEHPVTPHMTLLKTEQQAPTEVLREVQTSRGTGRERK